MSKSHREEVELTLGNQRDQFQEEYDEEIDELDGMEIGNQFKDDAQYKELIGSLQADAPLQPKKKSSRNLEDLPKYKGKKITRKEMQEIDQQDLMISDSDLEDEEEDDEDEQVGDSDENMDDEEEDDIEDSDEDDKPQVVKSKNAKRKQSKESIHDDEEEEEEEDNEESDLNEDAEFSQLKKMTKKIIEQKKNKSYIQDKMNVDEIIDEIDQEDQEINPKSQLQQEDEISKAKAVRQQIQLWKELVFVRFNMHKNLENIKKFPSPQDLGGFDSKETAKNTKYLELNILRNIDLIQKIRGNLIEKSNGPKDRILKKNQLKSLQKFIHHNNVTRDQYENENALNIQNLWKQYEESFDGMHNWMEDNILKWSQKTQLLNSINLKRSGLGALVHTPLGQTQKAMQQIENLIYKSQLKRTTFRILGRDVSNVQKETDAEIYDDSDIYHELLKEYMTEIEENKEVGEDGLLFDSTRLYLLERKLKQQEKKQKVVDRRASKSRKIRFDVHQKLVNFMNPIDNKELLEGRTEIIKCLFGKAPTEEQEEEHNHNEQNGTAKKANGNEEPSLNKKRKLGASKKKQQSESEEEDDDDVELI